MSQPWLTYNSINNAIHYAFMCLSLYAVALCMMTGQWPSEQEQKNNELHTWKFVYCVSLCEHNLIPSGIQHHRHRTLFTTA